jgi:hypothetical protein
MTSSSISAIDENYRPKVSVEKTVYGLDVAQTISGFTNDQPNPRKLFIHSTDSGMRLLTAVSPRFFSDSQSTFLHKSASATSSTKESIPSFIHKSLRPIPHASRHPCSQQEQHPN